jgi:hypothetical protein
MSSLNVRRIIVWGISAVLGIITTMLIMYILLPAVSPNAEEPTIDIARYGIQYFFWTAFPFTLIFVTILDQFMETKIWPD